MPTTMRHLSFQYGEFVRGVDIPIHSPRDDWPTYDIQHAAQEMLKNCGCSVPWGVKQEVTVGVSELHIQMGKIVPKFVQNLAVELPREPMSAEQFVEEKNKAIAALPEEFQEFITSQCLEYSADNDRSHEDTLSYAINLMTDLLPKVNAYTARITKRRTRS